MQVTQSAQVHDRTSLSSLPVSHSRDVWVHIRAMVDGKMAIVSRTQLENESPLSILAGKEHDKLNVDASKTNEDSSS